MFISLFLLINIFLIKNSSQDDFNCKKSDIDREIEIGDEVTLCIHSKEKKIKIASKLKVDEYSIVTIDGGFNNLAKEDTQESNSALRNNEEEKYEKNKSRRRMIIEPDNNNNMNDNNPNTIKTDIKNTILIETTTKTTIESTSSYTSINTQTQTQSQEEVEDTNPDDKSKIIAQIGDKITQYPSVIFYIIFL
jgi:hypothetical protein